MLAIVITGFEEVIMRSTMVYRDSFFRWLQGLPEPTEVEKQLQQRFWAASVGESRPELALSQRAHERATYRNSTGNAMYFEFGSIIICRMAYIMMQPHRFVFNLGYSSVGEGIAVTSVAVLFSGMFLELCFECEFGQVRGVEDE